MIAVVILGVLVLSAVVMVHELGHFLAAKRAGVQVEEFGLGIPPRLYGKRFGETLYSLNLLPFGGFVRLTGEDFETPGTAKDNKSFAAKSAKSRFFMLSAGIGMNFIFAFFIYYILLGINGFKSQAIPLYVEHRFPFGQASTINTVVTYMEPDSAAKAAGVMSGEAILEIDDKPVYSIKDVRAAVGDKSNKSVKILLMDLRSFSRPTRVLNATPLFSEEENRGMLGVVLSPAVTISYSSWYEKLLAGPLHSVNITGYTLSIFYSLIATSVETGDISPVSESVSGPVGVIAVVREIVKGGFWDSFISLLDLAGMLSLSLAVMNLLPIPALDGGRLAFVVWEMVTKKPIHPAKEAAVHKVGMLLLVALIIFITFRDVKNFFILKL